MSQLSLYIHSLFKTPAARMITPQRPTGQPIT